jgi:hypothetical protein
MDVLFSQRHAPSGTRHGRGVARKVDQVRIHIDYCNQKRYYLVLRDLHFLHYGRCRLEHTVANRSVHSFSVGGMIPPKRRRNGLTKMTRKALQED